MQHPFINDLSHLSIEDLQDKITDLTSKLSFSSRMNNQTMNHQIMMVLDSYRTEYNKRMDDLYKKQNIQNRIQIQKDKQ
jgi:hypothetical protein